MDKPDLPLASALMRDRRTTKPVDMDAARPVDRALVSELLENANWAPTHGLTEPWRFRVFTGAARERLAAAMQQIYRDVTPPAEWRDDKLEKLGKNPLLAPVLVVVWMERRGGDKIPEIEETLAVACAVQNLLLGATAAGLASFWSSPPLVYTQAFRDWLGIGAEDRCLGLIYLGWPRPGAPPVKSTRQPAAAKISWCDA